MNAITRRQVLWGGLGLAGAGFLAGCTAAPGRPATSPSPIPSPTPLTPSPGQTVVSATLTPRPVTLDLGGPTAPTWAYGDTLGTELLRAKAGDLLRVTVDNQLPTETSVHWHGIRLRMAADGVPAVTQPAIAAGQRYTYEFVAPDPGTYFFHPHSGVQIDRGLYAPLIIDDPAEPGGYDAEWVVVLDDWTDGIGPSPDDILASFQAQKGTVSTGMNHGNMGGMGHGSMGSPLGDAGDVNYPHYLVNGRIPTAPTTFSGEPGQRVRIRFVNAGADTIFRVALGGHVLTVTHADGFAVEPRETRSFYLAMGERLDVLVTLGDGVFPLVARPEGKSGTGWALVRTASGTAPTPGVLVSELDGTALAVTDLTAAESARLPDREPDAILDVQLNGQMQPYAWGINGRTFGQHTPLSVGEGQRVRLRMTNMTMMSHPMHIHGHTWGLPGSGGLRKDTVLVLPMQTVEADLQADNPGTWMYHCHNIYHAEIGMMTTLVYR
ncbi:multicopper oxidase family protein [Propioniciclava sinopodophylli]|uniref:multicopper oxidase family protein n=1 Tax=Propioniciclava sinopodophylli TaxID=1837344 RepID=UPI002490AE30|nr:multicopper oxidase family protein [Propioniciclava sinopodophylli]